MNTAIINKGVIVSRYTGTGGKSGSSEAGAEILHIIRKAVDR